MGSPILILCTAPASDDHAPRLARGLVEHRLAACVNLVGGVRSFYRWKGTVEDDAEVQLLIKTEADRLDALEAWLREHHPYDVPELVVLPIERGGADYLAWVTAQTRPEAT